MARRAITWSVLLAGTASAAPPATRPTSQPTTAPAVVAPVVTVVYDADFDRADEPDPHWSAFPLADTPAVPTRQFLGPLDEYPLKLKLDHLPPHAFVHVTFDLILYDRWNGDNVTLGRDLWDLRVVGGQPLVHTTFSDCGFFDNNSEQSYPDQYPWYPTHKAWTASAAHQTLGWRTSQSPDGWGCDSTYAIDVTFPHAADTLVLRMASQIKRHEAKPYGLLRCHVETVSGPAPATPAQLADWWADLDGDDPIRANRALWSLAATGDAATAFAAAHLPADGGPAPVHVDMTAGWTPGRFQYATAGSRQLARATHLLEVIGTPAAGELSKQIGADPTPQEGPPDEFTAR